MVFSKQIGLATARITAPHFDSQRLPVGYLAELSHRRLCGWQLVPVAAANETTHRFQMTFMKGTWMCHMFHITNEMNKVQLVIMM